MTVKFAPKVVEYLANLIEALYYNNYFGFKENAKKYVQELVIEIETSINKKRKRVAPSYFSKYGQHLYYTGFYKNKNTTWYVFFNYENDIYYIRYIGNNHTCSQYL